MPTVLVIDDDAQIHHFIQTVLEPEGFEVRRADDGEQGVREYRREPTGLVLCDIFMVRQEGLETIRQLRNLDPQAKIIAMSGGGSEVPGDFLPLARKLGALACLPKPLERGLLMQTIQVVMNDRGDG